MKPFLAWCQSTFPQDERLSKSLYTIGDPTSTSPITETPTTAPTSAQPTVQPFRTMGKRPRSKAVSDASDTENESLPADTRKPTTKPKKKKFDWPRSQYEVDREEQIRKNNLILQQMGLDKASEELFSALPKPRPKPRPTSKPQPTFHITHSGAVQLCNAPNQEAISDDVSTPAPSSTLDISTLSLIEPANADSPVSHDPLMTDSTVGPLEPITVASPLPPISIADPSVLASNAVQSVPSASFTSSDPSPFVPNLESAPISTTNSSVLVPSINSSAPLSITVPVLAANPSVPIPTTDPSVPVPTTDPSVPVSTTVSSVSASTASASAPPVLVEVAPPSDGGSQVTREASESLSPPPPDEASGRGKRERVFKVMGDGTTVQRVTKGYVRNSPLVLGFINFFGLSRKRK
jgi:hypothetical protein